MMGRMQQHSCSSLVFSVMVSIAGIVLSVPSSSHRSRVRNQNLKVRITATGDTIVMKFLRPNLDTKLEGYILGYGSSMFSKQFIQLPENGQPYETEFDAEPKYLIAVQPVPTNEVKKQCAGKVELEKPLHLVIGSVTPTSVLLSWGTLLKTPYEGNIMNDCLEDGHYTVRYREKNRRWNYQTCPTSDTVIDNLKPNTVYEFGVQPNSKDGSGTWSKPVIHNISSGIVEEKVIRKIFKRPINPVKPLPGPNSFPFAPRHVLHNRTKGKLPTLRNITPKTTIAPIPTTRQEKLSTPGTTVPVITRQLSGGGDVYRSVLPPFHEVPLGPKLRSPIQISVPSTHSVTVPQENVENHGGHPVIGSQQKPWSTGYVQTQTKPPWQQLPLKPRLHPQQSDLELLAKIESQSKSTFKFPPQIPPTSQLPPTYQPISQTQHGSQPMQNGQTIPQILPTSQPQPRFQHPTLTQPDSQLLPIYHQVIDAQPESKALPMSNPIIEDLPESPPLPLPFPIIKAQPESQPLPISDPIIDALSESQPLPTSHPIRKDLPGSQTLSKSPPKTKAQPESRPLSISHPIIDAQPESQPLPISHPLIDAQSESQPLPISHPIVEAQPKSQPIPVSHPMIDTQSESRPLPISHPIVEAQPESQPLPISNPITEARYESHPPPRFHQIPQIQPGAKPLSISKPMKKDHTESQIPPTSQSKFQSSYQPQHKQMNSPTPDILNHPMTHVKSKFTLQTKPQSQPQPTPPFRLPTTTPLWSQPVPYHHSQPQTAPPTNLAFQPHSTIQLKRPSQTQSEENHQMKQIQPADLATTQTPQSTHGYIFQTQQGLPKTHIEPQQNSQSARPQTLSNHKHETEPPQLQPQQKQHSKPKIDKKQQTKGQIKPKSNTDLFSSKSNIKNNNPSKKQSTSLLKPQPSVRTKVKIYPQSKNQSRHQSEQSNIQVYPLPPFQPTSPSQFPKTGQDKSHSKSLPKPHPASKSQPQLQHGSLFEHHTRNLSDPTKVAARQAVPTAPSPPEEGKPLPRPALATEKAGSYDHGTGILKPSTAEVPRSSINSSPTTPARNTTLSRTRVPPHSTRNSGRSVTPPKTFTSSHSSRTPGADGAHHKGNALPKPVVWSKEKPAVLHPSVPVNKSPNLVGKPTGHDKPMDLKQGEQESILKPFPLVTAKPKQERRQQSTTTNAPALNSISNTTFNGTRFDINQNSSIFRPLPASEVDLMGRMRFVAPHVIYKTDKGPNEPCSITSSLAYFPDEEGNEQNVTGPPRSSPSNLTVVTVEGCPSFVILDWQKSDNETREYEVVSTTKGPNGEEVSVLTTNQTHTAVENLKPESSYEFKVTPKNELGTGPSSDPVSFNTESADPRVSEHASGKDAIWTQFPFKADAYSDCNGKQYVKRTWYRKFVGIQLCNSLRYKIYLSDSLSGKFYNIGDQTGYGEDHCQFVDSFLDGRTGTHIFADQLQSRPGFYRAMRQEPVSFGEIGGKSHITYVGWYECGTPIPGKW